MIVDSHCHLDSMKSFTLSSEVLPVTVGYSHRSNLKNEQIGSKLNIPFVLGIAPQTAQAENLSRLDEWISYIRSKRPNAIGEVGLDFHWAKTQKDKDSQFLVFEKMIALAEEMRLPLVLHGREALHEILGRLEERKFGNGFMTHFFSGSEEDARRTVENGGYISIPTQRSKARKNAILETELDNLLIETDSPLCAPGPEHVIKAAGYIAEIKKLDRELVVEQTAKNAFKFFAVQT